MRQPIIQLAPRRQHGQHPALILQRYLARTITGDNGDPAERRALLDAAICASQSEPLRAIYADAYPRWNDSFPQDDLNLAVELNTAGRLIVGLGSENVLEAGIRLHHTYGVPLIPGSALKGLASHYCHEVWGQRHVETPHESNRLFRRGESYHSLLFGTTEDGGVIAFHDAWITPDSLRDGSLRLDVMTPHHTDFQRGPLDSKFREPTDFDSPIPVSFLSVAGTFRVRLCWCGPLEVTQEKAQAWTKLAFDLLQEALTEWGIGGKTSSGYGRLVTSSTVRAIPTAQAGSQTRTPDVPRSGTRVEAVLLEEKTTRGGWKARHDSSGLVGPIHNGGDVPGDKKPGDNVSLIVAYANPRDIAFRYPTAADERQTQKPKGKPKGGQGGQQPRGRR